ATAARGDWLAWTRRRLGAPGGWLVPGALVTASAVVAIAVLPALLSRDQQSLPESEVVEMAADAGQDGATGIEDGGLRLGARPVPQGPLELDSLPVADQLELTVFETAGLRLGHSLEQDVYKLYLIFDG